VSAILETEQQLNYPEFMKEYVTVFSDWGLSSLRELNELDTETMELLTPVANTGKKMNELSTETLALLLSDVYIALTFHDLSDNEPVVTTLFII
jgi:hypothetical protein